MSQTEIDIAEAVIVRTKPGDTVVFRCSDNRVSLSARQQFEAAMSERLSGVKVVLACGVDEIKVFRPEFSL